MRGLKRTAIALIAMSAWLAPGPQLATAAPGPAWQLSLVALPTNLAPGSSGTPTKAPMFMLIATNIGAGDAVGPVTFSATFPAGVTPVFGSNSPDPRTNDDEAVTGTLTCSKTPSQTVTCTAPGSLRPSRYVAARMPVEVSEGLEAGQVLEDAVASVESPGATKVTAATAVTIDTEPPPFGFLPGPAGFSTMFTQEEGSPALAAGSHPNQMTTSIGFPVDQPDPASATTGSGHPRDVVTDLPQGVVVNPNATGVRCSEAEMLSGGGGDPGCPEGSQIGLVTVVTEITGPNPSYSALFNMVPAPGSAATLSFDAANVGIYVHLAGSVRSESDFGLSASTHDVLARAFNPLENVQAQLWGDPSSSSHDRIRGHCRPFPKLKCEVEPRDTPLLTMPSACSDTMAAAVHARSWEEADEGIPVSPLPHEARAVATDVSGDAKAVSGCSLLDFDPSFTLRPDTSAAESPAGIEAELKVPQSKGGEPATSNVRDVAVTFPQGMALNPAAADGLQACSPVQIGLRTGVGQSPPHFSDARPQCPDGSKVGTVEVSTPLLDHSLPGSVYVAQPYDNPFGTLLGVYIVVDSPEDGVVIKLAGKTEADPNTGQLTATFTENPELPVSEFKVNLFGGPRAALRTPSTCGTYTTTSVQVPWSGNPPAHTSDSFEINRGPNGGPCVSDEASMPNSPGFDAGTETPLAADYSPLGGRLSREDGTQQLRSLDLTLPPGLTGKLAGVEQCSEAAIAAAGSKSGQQELSSPSCPANSQIGEVTVGAGAGPAPYYTTGRIYLAGPYRGAPLSGVVITPALAGPFDLGTVVVRAPAYLDPITAQLRISSDDFPHILKGIPLRAARRPHLPEPQPSSPSTPPAARRSRSPPRRSPCWASWRRSPSASRSAAARALPSSPSSPSASRAPPSGPRTRA